MMNKRKIGYKQAIEMIWIYNEKNKFKDDFIDFICRLAEVNENEKKEMEGKEE